MTAASRAFARPPARGQKQGKLLLLHPFERELRQARELWEQPQVREMYRVRSQCERLINQVVRHGARKARAFGLGAAQLQVHIIAIGCNLAVLARMLDANADLSATLLAA